MGKGPTKQHYIPQLYLRNFAIDEKVWTYFKSKKTSQQISIKSAFVKNNIYTIGDNYTDGVGNKIDPFFYEKCFFANGIEEKYNTVLKEILDYKNEFVAGQTNVVVTHELLMKLSQHVIIQFLRMPQQQQRVEDLIESPFMQQILDIFKILVSQITEEPKIKELEVKLKVKDQNLLNAQLTYDCEELTRPFMEDLYYKKYWDFLVDDNNNICTSDSPFIIITPIEGQRPFNLGLDTYGSVIMFPLSSDLILRLSDKRTHSHVGKKDRQFSFIDSDSVEYFNKMLYEQSKISIICKNNNFDFAENKVIKHVKQNNHWSI